MVQEVNQIPKPEKPLQEPSPSVCEPVTRNRPWLSVVIPAKDESERLPETLRLLMFELKLQKISYEIVAVDDGSTDGTMNELTQMLEAPLKVLHHEKRMGIAAAFRSGAMISRGKYVMLCPADICDFSFLQEATQSCRHVDLVSVSKRHPKSVVVGYDKWRWFLSNNYHRFVTLLFRIPDRCRDTHYIKIYRADLLSEILPLCKINGAVGETEIVYHAARIGARMLDIPGRVIHNHSGSKTSMRRVVETLLDLMRLWIYLQIADFNHNT